LIATQAGAPTMSGGGCGPGSSGNRMFGGYSAADLRGDAMKAGIEVVRKPAEILTPAKIPIDQRLEQLGIRYKDPQFERGILLPLPVYDDQTFVFRQPEEWKATGFPLRAQCLRVHENGSGSYQQCVAIDFSVAHRKFVVRWYPLTEALERALGDPSKKGGDPSSPGVAAVGESIGDYIEPLHVYFEGEDLELYCQRVARCHQRRRYAESLIKYNFFVDNMPTNRVGTCPDQVFRRVTRMAMNTRELRGALGASASASGGAAGLEADGLEDSVSQEAGAGGSGGREDDSEEELGIAALCQEVGADYARAMNKIIFDKVVSTEKERNLLADLELPPASEVTPHLRRFQIGGSSSSTSMWGRFPCAVSEGADFVAANTPAPPDVPFRGVRDILEGKGSSSSDGSASSSSSSNGPPGVDFRNLFSKFCQSSLRIRPEVVAALQEIQCESQAVLDRVIFRSQYFESSEHSEKIVVPNAAPDLEKVSIWHKPYTPGDFLQTETAEITKMSYLKDKYIPNVRAHVYKQLNAVEQKWFNLYETDSHRYMASRLRSFLEEIDLRLQDTVHTLGVKSLHYFEKLINLYVPLEVKINGLQKVETIHKPLPGSLGARGLGPDGKPKPVVLFQVNVILILEKKNAPIGTEVGDRKATGSNSGGPSAIAAMRRNSRGSNASKESVGSQRRGSALFRKAANSVMMVGAMKSASKERRRNSLRRSSFAWSGGGGDTEEEKDDRTFGYDVNPKTIVDMLGYLFDKGISKLDDISSIQLLMLPHLFGQGQGFLDKGFKKDDAWVNKLRASVKCAMEQHLPWLAKVLEYFSPYEETIALDPYAKVGELETKFVDDGPDSVEVKDIQKLVEEQRSKMEKIKTEIPDVVNVGFVQVKCAAFKAQLVDKLERMAQLYLGFLANKKLGHVLSDCTESFSGMFTELKKPVMNIQELVDKEDYMKSLESDIAKLQTVIDENIGICDLLTDKYNFKLSREISDNRWKMFGSPGDVCRLIADTNEKMERQRVEFLDENKGEQAAYEELFTNLKSRVADFTQYDDLGQVEEVAQSVKEINELLAQCQDNTKKFNQRELLFDATTDPTDYGTLSELIKQFEPFENLWRTAGDWVSNKQKWLFGRFDEVDAKFTEDEVTSGIKLMFKTIRTLQTKKQKQQEDLDEWAMEHGPDEPPDFEVEDLDGIINIAAQIKTELEAFKPNLPLIAALRNPGIWICECRLWICLSI